MLKNLYSERKIYFEHFDDLTRKCVFQTIINLKNCVFLLKEGIKAC